MILSHCKTVNFVAQRMPGTVILLSLFFTGAQAGELRYVSDQLTLNMYKDTSLNTRLSPLKSGDKVEVLKHDDGYTQVKTVDGTVGWVKSSYLLKDKPAAIRLTEVQAELDTLRSKHTDMLIEQTEVPVPQDTELQSRLQAAEEARQGMEQRLGELEAEKGRHIQEIRELKKQQPVSDDPRFFLLWIILPILTLITGFFLGWKYLESKIRARFGGFNPI